MKPTLRTVLIAAKQALLSISATPALDAEILLAHALQITRTQLFMNVAVTLTATDQVNFQHLLARRLAGEPIAYLIGYREFWSLPFMVTTATLIPRPETEELVQCALTCLPANTLCTVADLGTGSGAIAVALATERPAWHIVATDNSTTALAVARQNAARLRATAVEFYAGDWCNALPSSVLFDAIISNPPYIDAQDAAWRLEETQFEPRTALLAAAAGMADLHAIIKHARAHLKPGGWLMLEHGYNQHRAVNELLSQYGYHLVDNVLDLANIMRIAVARVS